MSAAGINTILEILLTFPPRLHSRIYPTTPSTLNTYNMSYEDRMQKALAELESSSKPNYAVTARKYDLERTTLAKRVKG
ncbi:hypothetical protein G7Y89_g9665 [Cudoniella acicularis]|uniref:Uncharacterized protein n=1 Tax=Cudoniella acicularis TaxID=354080 RepID=A0A8H4RGW5_9HELO|nr:hypothetical protein G7Y89_g9665 [Cudoniella acicularis]